MVVEVDILRGEIALREGEGGRAALAQDVSKSQ